MKVVRLGPMRPGELLARPIEDHLDPREHRRVQIGLRVVKLLADVQRRELEQTTDQQCMVEYETAVDRFARTYGASEHP
jgi:hypothetical protein